MRTKQIVVATLVLFFAATAGRTAPAPQPQQNPAGPLPAATVPAQQTPAEQAPAQKAPASPSTIKTQTRLITVDVIATDSHGNPVRGLKQDDFQVMEERIGAQKIARFEFVDTATSAAAESVAQPAPAPGVYSNMPGTRLKVPPTILLMDALNTGTTRQIQVRRDMILFLKKLPKDTPVAVFLLGHTLHVVQNFTTDPGLLQAAVDKAHRPEEQEANPQDDVNSASNTMRNSPLQVPEDVLERLEDFEKEQYMEQISQRVDETAAAMFSIAKYLGGYPGRKNLIWFSESFPLWIAPTADFGSNPFQGTNSYGPQVREAAEALTDARVSVYPVDARGLEASGMYTASQNPNIDQRNPPASLAGTLRREDDERTQSQATMDEVADDTGGKVCKNTNDLAGCVQSALNEGSSYYEIAYYPADAKWDGHFHKITVKTTQHGVKLAFRRGYFATDPTSQERDPAKLLQAACSEALPSGAIALTVQTLPGRPMPGEPVGAKYLLTISPNALSLTSADGPRWLNLKMAICEFDPKGDSFQFFPHDLSQPASDASYEAWKAHGIRDIFDYAAKPDNERLRFAVLDVPSGVTGSVDVPAHPHEFATVPELVGPATSANPAAAAASPAAAPVKPPVTMMTKLNFRAGDNTSSLDWSGDKVWYHGDLGINQAAPAFFKTIYSEKFHCEAGSLIPNDSSSAAKVNFLFTFRNPAGPVALVELAGSEPVYTGTLTVDPSAKAFFDYLWKLCHCQQP
jgi:VWFA-related protein